MIGDEDLEGTVGRESRFSSTPQQGVSPNLNEEFRTWFARKDLNSLDHASSESGGKKQGDNGFQNWLKRMLASLFSNTRIFVTQRGYIGRTCKHSKPGDKLVFINGAPCPFLLRPCASSPSLKVQNDLSHPESRVNMTVQSEGILTYEIIGGGSYVYRLGFEQVLELVKEESLTLTRFLIL